MMHAKALNIAGLVLSVILIGPIVGWTLHELTFKQRPPLIIHGGIAMPSVIKPGDKLTIKWTIQRVEECFGTINAFVIDSMTGGVVWRDDIPGGYTAVMSEPREVMVHIDIPTLPAGLYRYEATRLDVCHGGPVLSQQPAIPFEVR